VIRSLLVVLLLLWAVPASAATYYVSLPTNSPAGSDARSCATSQTITTPKATINSGFACLAAGDTLLIRGGTYAERINNVVKLGTSWAVPIRIAAYPQETVWMKPAAGVPWVLEFFSGQTYLDFDGINLDTTNATAGNGMGGVSITSGAPYNADHIRFQNATIIGNRIAGDVTTSRVGITLVGANGGTDSGDNEVTNVTIYGSGGPNTYYGMYIHTSNNVVDRCHIYDVSYIGIQIYDGAANPTGNVIKNCIVHNIDTANATYGGRYGLLFGGNNTQVYNNVIYNINSASSGVGVAIHVFDGNANLLYNNTIANNTLSGAGAGAIVIGGLRLPTNTLVTNNIAYGNTGSNTVVNDGIGTVQTTNLFGTNPNFVNQGANDFRLQASSTAAIDTGTTTAFTTDILGFTRPQGSAFDRGAYEYVGSVDDLCDAPGCVAYGANGSTDGQSATLTLIVSAAQQSVVLASADTLDLGSTPTDSLGDTLVLGATATDGQGRIRIYHIQNPSIGTHVFTMAAVVNSYPCMAGIVSGTRSTSSLLDQQNASATGTPGSVTPTSDNQVAITGVNLYTDTSATINGSFLIPVGATVPWVSAQHVGCSIAYLTQTSAAAANPVWTFTASSKTSGIGTYRVYSDTSLPIPPAGPPRFRLPFKSGGSE